MKEFGQIGTQSLLNHEMAETSPVEKMSYHQSQMHFDESMEIIADSDLEDGELQKLLTSPLYADAMVERLIHQKIIELPGNGLLCFH